MGTQSRPDKGGGAEVKPTGSRLAPGVTAPRQQRSRDTMDRILEATERLLRERDFEDLTIGEIVSDAGSSVGSFYQRFGRKEALLPYLIGRLIDEQSGVAHHLFVETDWTGVPLRDRLSMLLLEAVRTGEEKRGVMRAALKREMLDSARVSAHEWERLSRMNALLRDWLLECRAEMDHEDPDEAVRVAMLFAFSAIHSKVFFGGSARARDLRISDEELAGELTRAVVSYLCRSSGDGH